ncbi:hypothetical protein Y710_04750 [Gordonia sp. QH-12]|nr:hypothetical protein Y710_04750 [Gordonia sp. QH-12]
MIVEKALVSDIPMLKTAGSFEVAQRTGFHRLRAGRSVGVTGVTRGVMLCRARTQLPAPAEGWGW